MSTVLDIAKRSLRLLGVHASGESLGADEGNDALQAANSLLESWNNEKLMLYNIKAVTKVLTPGTGTYAIGTGAAINTDKPISIESAFIRDTSNNDYRLTLISDHQYSLIVDKTTGSNYPTKLYYRPTHPNGDIILWRVPSAAYTLVLNVCNQITAFAALSTTVSLPKGYQRAFEYNLAIEIAPEYGVEPVSSIYKIAAEAKRWIKIVNSKNTPVLRSPALSVLRPGGFDINLGEVA